ncbi:MAG: exo-alpha-sialidase [Deltaproteobacteria bacterium]|nr:exo-alpha-sialidase [Deltaproteobacteria bacterium]
MVATVPAGAAVGAFGPTVVVNSNAATDNVGTDYHNRETYPVAVAVGPERWLALWQSYAPLPGGGGGGEDQEIVRSISTDDGRTWSSMNALLADASFDERFAEYVPAAESDGADVAVVPMWYELTWPNDGGRRVGILRSEDQGETWSSLIQLSSTGSDNPPGDIATDGAGNWVAVFASDDSLGGTIGTDYDILFVSSSDNGLTWSAPAPVSSHAATDGGSWDIEPKVATDRAGTWVVAWECQGTGDAISSTTHDLGATWSAPAVVVSPASGYLGEFDIETDGAGNWLVASTTHGAWEAEETRTVRSTDAGASWGPKVYLGATGVTPDLIWAGGQWKVCFGTQAKALSSPDDDTDLVCANSVDGGASWSSLAVLNRQISTGAGSNAMARLAYDGAGGWLAIWQSEDPLDGSLGIDADIFAAAAHDDCPAAPAPDCTGTTVPARSTVRVQDKPAGSGGGDLAVWTMRNAESTALADLGDPTTATSYALCLYDQTSGVAELVHELDAPAGTGWTAIGAGYRFADKSRLSTPVTAVKLQADGDEVGRFRLKASGLTLAPPRLPLAQDTEVIAQLRNLQSGRCWEAVYSQASTNDATRFSARSD